MVNIYVFCIYLRRNIDLCHLQHKLIGFYNRDEKCLQRGTDWVFKESCLRFIFKWLRKRSVERRNKGKGAMNDIVSAELTVTLKWTSASHRDSEDPQTQL